MNRKKSIVEYDMLRVVLTLLVVIGHCYYYEIATNYGGIDYNNLYSHNLMEIFLEFLKNTIYVFHMPAFIALSGALFFYSIERVREGGFYSFIREKGLRLLVPYLVVSLLYSFPLKLSTGYFSGCSSIVKAEIIGQILVQGNTHLWYLLTLFCLFILAFVLEKIDRNSHIVKFFVLLIISSVYVLIPIKIIAYIVQYLPWFYLGIVFEENRMNINSTISLKKIIFSGGLLCVGSYVLNYFLKNRIKGSIWLLIDYLMIFVGCYFIYSLSFGISKTKLVNKRIFRKIKEHSFGIYLYSDGINYIFLYIASAIGIRFNSNILTLTVFCARFVITLVVSLFLSMVLKSKIVNAKYIA